jgi:3'-phosphoadenosine 5'-phosphosulfate sulfotransferase (PAPS reductase)/FAD synthetase
MYIIFGNYGNETLALMQWAHERQLAPVTVVNIETGWAAEGWQTRVEQAQQYAKQCGFSIVSLPAKKNFVQLMKEQKNFPSTKFQWCAGFLKGLPFLDWLDKQDALNSGTELTILIAQRRALSRAQANMPEFVEASGHYGDRKVWYPLFDATNETRNELLQRAGFSLLPHRSLECDPCVNNTFADFTRLQPMDIKKTAALEQTLKQSMFTAQGYGDSQGIEQVVAWIKKNDTVAKTSGTELLDMGCGAPFGCGL